MMKYTEHRSKESSFNFFLLLLVASMESRISLFFLRLILMLQRILFFLLSLSLRAPPPLFITICSLHNCGTLMAFKWKSRAAKGAARSVVRGISWIWKLKLFFSPPPPPPRTLYYEDDDDDAEWWENNFSRFRCVVVVRCSMPTLWTEQQRRSTKKKMERIDRAKKEIQITRKKIFFCFSTNLHYLNFFISWLSHSHGWWWNEGGKAEKRRFLFWLI